VGANGQRVCLRGLALLLFAFGSAIGSTGAASAQVREPPTFWTGPPSGAVPTTLNGGRVIHAKALSTLLKRHDVIVVDVSNEEKRPAGLGPEVLWSVPPHAAIPGSHWLPGVGVGAITRSSDEFYRRELLKLTGGQLDRPLVIYCHQHCWLSWNAAKRAIGYGFRRVYWLPEGIEGWRAAGLPTRPTSPTRE
jgi:PQQ-dependent catabolism-associated CXXCW motif protein